MSDVKTQQQLVEQTHQRVLDAFVEGQRSVEPLLAELRAQTAALQKQLAAVRDDAFEQGRKAERNDVTAYMTKIGVWSLPAGSVADHLNRGDHVITKPQELECTTSDST